jgi:hypothetical protein
MFLIAPNILLAVDDGPRMYWNGYKDMNILQTYYWKVNGNSVSPRGTIANPNADVNMDLLVVGYNRISELAGHSLILTAVATSGNIDASLSAITPENDIKNLIGSSRGLGDIYFQGTLNIFGAPSLSAEEFATYKQETLLSLLIGVTTPTGDYKSHRMLNMGENRWNLRVGLPFVQTIGDWVAGEITTIEILPSVWIYDENDAFGNHNLTQDNLYTLEAHITHDITTTMFISLDYMLQSGGETYIDDIAQNDAQHSDSLGFSVGYQINEQTQFMLRYSASLNPNPDRELDVGILQFNINYFW